MKFHAVLAPQSESRKPEAGALVAPTGRSISTFGVGLRYLPKSTADALLTS